MNAPDTQCPTPTTPLPPEVREAAELARQIKEMEDAKPDLGAIAAKFQAAADALLDPVALEIAELKLSIEKLEEPYAERIDAIQVEQQKAVNEAVSAHKVQVAAAKLLRERLADLLVAMKHGGGVPEAIKSLIPVEVRTVQVADPARAFASIKAKVPEADLPLYFEVNEAGIDLVETEGRIKEGKPEEAHARLAKDWAGFTLDIAKQARIGAVPDLPQDTAEGPKASGETGAYGNGGTPCNTESLHENQGADQLPAPKHPVKKRTETTGTTGTTVFIPPPQQATSHKAQTTSAAECNWCGKPAAGKDALGILHCPDCAKGQPLSPLASVAA